jgi:ubiquinone/menaquinone biosynthesis C-methylase UbiE
MSHIHSKTGLLRKELIIEKSGLKSGQQIADLGCGRGGHFSFQLAKLVGVRGMVYAVDVIKHYLDDLELELKRQEIKNIQTIWTDLELLGAAAIDSSSVDIVFVINTLHQAKKPIDLLKEATRISKRGARLIVVDWSRSASPLGPDENIRIDKNKLVDAGKKIGLYLDSEFSAGPYHFGLVLTKM